MQHYYDTALVLEGGIVDSIPVQYAMDQGYEHPLVVLTRNKGYNQTMDLIEKLEDEGKITVIRPENPVNVGRMENDTAKLAALYDEGYKLAEKFIALLESCDCFMTQSS